MTDLEFNHLSRMIQRETGIQVPPHKRPLLVSRLSRRLRSLGLRTFTDYLEYLTKRDGEGRERLEMVNAVTTNTTNFFREEHHFHFLTRVVFPECWNRCQKGGELKIRLWSAGCSTGEEPYSIAMTLADYFGDARGKDVRILASDLDTRVLETAERGVYTEDQIRALSALCRERWLTPVWRNGKGGYRIHEDLRSLVSFRRINLQEFPWPVRTEFDAIFCRNVMIYFSRETVMNFVEQFLRYLKPGGYFFIGHSENLLNVTPRLKLLRNTIYQLTE